jgi:glycosyltransferase involved in cell wall biosynthesis
LVAQIIDELPPDGAERLLVDLMRRRSGRFRYVIVCLVKGGPLESEFAALGIPVVIIGRTRKLDIGMVFKLARWMRQEQVAVVHTHLFTADVFGRIAARLAGVRAVFSTSHNVNGWKGRAHRMLDRALSMISSRVVGCTEEVGRVLVQRDGIAARKVAVVENGVDLRRFDSVSAEGVREEFGIAADAMLMGVVGRLHPQKGHEDLLQAFVRLRSLTGAKFQCLFIGEGELRAQLEEQVTRMGLNDVVRFTGLRKDVPRLLVALDLFVMPSRWEGLPMALLEAMACGKPCVVTSVGGIPSVIDDGANGLMLPPEQPELMAQALARVIGDAELRRSLGATARDCALRRYDVGRALQAYESMYDEALGTEAPAAALPADGAQR